MIILYFIRVSTCRTRPSCAAFFVMFYVGSGESPPPEQPPAQICLNHY